MRPRYRVALVLLALVMALAGCGKHTKPGVATANGGKATPKASSSTASAADREDALLKYAQCMRDHGVDMPDPDPNGGLRLQGGPGDEAKIDAAQKACQSLLPNGGVPPTPSAEDLEKARQFAQCMRDHGISDFPDPDPNGGGIRINGDANSDMNPDNPTFKAAMEACNSLQPGGGKRTNQEAGA